MNDHLSNLFKTVEETSLGGLYDRRFFLRASRRELKIVSATPMSAVFERPKRLPEKASWPRVPVAPPFPKLSPAEASRQERPLLVTPSFFGAPSKVPCRTSQL